MMQKRGLWLLAPGWQALAETLAGAFIFETWLLTLAEELGPSVTAQGYFFLTVLAALWTAFRWRGGSRVFLHSMLMTAVLAMSNFYLYGFMLDATNMHQIVGRSGLGPFVVQVMVLAVGPFFLGLRVLIALIQRWSRMRGRRLRWAILHGHFLLIAGFVGIWTLFFSFMVYRSSDRYMEEMSLAGTVMSRLIVTLFPVVVIAVLTALVAFVLLSLPLALAAYRISRPVTRRIESLASAVRRLSKGSYGVQLDVAGEDEVAQLQRTFNSMSQDLAAANAAVTAEKERVAELLDERRNWVAKVSHDLRTPLAALAVALEQAPDDDRSKLLRHQVQRLSTLVEDLFAFSLLETRSLTFNCQPVDVAAVASHAVASLCEHAWQRARVTLQADVSSALPLIQLDAARLEQVLINLIDNGVAHTPPGDVVMVTVHQRDMSLAVQVMDTGPGIAAEDLPHVWQRFWRGETSPARGGAGLGLALVKELTEAMGGTAAVSSEPGQGAVFTLTFPLP